MQPNAVAEIQKSKLNTKDIETNRENGRDLGSPEVRERDAQVCSLSLSLFLRRCLELFTIDTPVSLS